MWWRTRSAVGRFSQGRAYAWAVAAILAFGLWLRWPALFNGFFLDDFSAVAMAEGAYAAPRHKLDLFNFTSGTPADYALLMNAGSLPWWTVPGLRLAMLRPLSSALVLFDRALFGADPIPYHVHSFVWWIGAMLAVAALFRELFSPALAALALLLFVLDEGHSLPLGWLTNRGTLVAMVFGLVGLRLHMRYRRQQSTAAAWSACLCFSIGLASGEWAFPLLGYVLAFQLWSDRGPFLGRIGGLWPAAIPGLTFLLCRSAFGYGALNSGVYTDPLSEPARFAYMFCVRIPVYLADLTFSVPSHWWGFNTPWRDELLALDLISHDVWIQLPSWQFWHITLGLAGLLTTVAALRFGLRSRPESERHELRWLLAGAGISLIPMVSSFPTSRLVLPAALAWAALAGSVLLAAAAQLAPLGRWLAAAIGRPPARPPRGVTASFRASAPIVAGAFWLGLTLNFQAWQPGMKSFHEIRWLRRGYESVRQFVLQAEIDDDVVAKQRVVILNGIEHTSTIFAPYVRWFFGHPKPRAMYTLSAAPFAHDFYRPAPNVLEMSVLGGTLLLSEFEQLYRAPRFEFHRGDVIDAGAFKAEIVRMVDRRPQLVRFTFDRDIDDPSFLFLHASPEGMVRARLPEVGERARFRRPGVPSVEAYEARRAARLPNVACPGVQPPIEECRQGFFFADCGGNGPPVLACRLFQNDCRWFIRGCVADGYEASSCAPARPCCVPNDWHGDAGLWPFARASFMTEPRFAEHLADDLQAWGRAGWDVDASLVVPVELEPSLASLPPLVRCVGVPGDRGPCGAGLLDVAPPRSSSLYFVFRAPGATPTWALTVEVLDDRAGQLRSRICRLGIPQPGAAGDCGADRSPRCAVAGLVTLNAFPIEARELHQLAGRIRAEFSDGSIVEAEF